MTPVPGCPHAATIERLANEMWYVEDAVTIRLREGEGRMERIERNQTAINSKFWAIILLLAAAIITTSTAIVQHAISAPPTHSSMF